MSDSVTVPTTSERLTDLSNAASYDGLLKDVYLPGLTDTVFNDASFTALIRQTTDDIDYEGQRVIKGFKHQRAGGVGPIAEGGDFRASVPAAGQQGFEQLKYLNVYFSITGPAIRAAQQGPGSFVSAATDAFDDMISNAKNDLERQITGSGNGVIATVGNGTNAQLYSEAEAEALTSDSTAMEFTSIDNGGYFASQFFIKGQGVDVYSSDFVAKKNNIAMHVADIPNNGTSIKIAHDTYNADAWNDDINKDDVFVNRDAYTGAGGTCLEINGLANLVDSTGTSWNLPRADHSFLQSIEQTSGGVELTESLLLKYMIEMQYQHQANPNLLIVDPNSLLVYFQNEVGAAIDGLRRFNVNQAMEWIGGYQGLGIQLGTKQLMLTAIGSMRIDKSATPNTGDLYMINTDDFAFATMTNGYEWLTPGGRILQQKEGSDNQFASAVNYMNFICYDPGRQLKATGIDVTPD